MNPKPQKQKRWKLRLAILFVAALAAYVVLVYPVVRAVNDAKVKRNSAAKSGAGTTSPDLDRLAATADGWIRDADVVVETVAVPRGAVRILRPPAAAAGTNIVVQFHALHEALGAQRLSTAVLIIPEVLDDENMTNAVGALTQVGLSVRVVVERWGRRWPGPKT